MAEQEEEIKQQQLLPGDGIHCPLAGDKVLVHYTGKLEDGTVVVHWLFR